MSIKQKQKGFSVFELMIAVAIGSLIVTVAVPSFSNSIANQRMVSTTNEMVMAFTLAKSEAIKRVGYVSVCPSDDGATCGADNGWNDGWIVFANDGVANLNQVNAGDEIIRIYPQLHERVNVQAAGNVADFVSFRPSGTLGTNASNITGTLTTCDWRGADKATGIVLQPSGRWSISHDKSHAGDSLTCPEADS